MPIYCVVRASGPLAIVPIVAFNALALVLLVPVSTALGVAGTLVIGVLSYVACLPWRVRTSATAIGVVAAVKLSVLFFLWSASPVLAIYGLVVSATASGLSYLVNTPLRT